MGVYEPRTECAEAATDWGGSSWGQPERQENPDIKLRIDVAVRENASLAEKSTFAEMFGFWLTSK